MRAYLHKLERFVDDIIPPLLFLLLVAIIGEFFFSSIFESYSRYVDVLDGFTILIFILDLSFKYERAKHAKKFIKRYWLEIIAVLPFFLVFRLLEAFSLTPLLGSAIQGASAIAKLEQKTAAILAKDAVLIGNVSRTTRFLRLFRIFGRLSRFLPAIHFYEKPTGRHYPHER